MLNAGWFTSAAGIWRRDDDLDRQIRFPVPAYVIETAEERILVDTGLHPAAVDDAARHYGTPDALGMFELELDASIGEQVDLSTITRVVLTHLHFDHAGGLALLPSSVPIVVQRREWAAGHDAEGVKKNFFLPADYGSVDEQIVLIDGDHDLLGDGSIQLLLTPGHTPGHQSVRVGERLVIGGDVTHYASGPGRPPVPDVRRRLRRSGRVGRPPAGASRRRSRRQAGARPRRSRARSRAGVTTPAAHGFEGLGLLLVETPPDDASAAQGHDGHASRRHLDSVPTAHARSVRHHDVVAAVDELVRRDGDPIERVEEGAPEAAACVVSAIDACFDASGA